MNGWKSGEEGEEGWKSLMDMDGRVGSIPLALLYCILPELWYGTSTTGKRARGGLGRHPTATGPIGDRSSLSSPCLASFISHLSSLMFRLMLIIFYLVLHPLCLVLHPPSSILHPPSLHPIPTCLATLRRCDRLQASSPVAGTRHTAHGLGDSLVVQVSAVCTS